MRALRHPAYPLMVQVPIGSWLSTAVLDLYSGSSREAVLLVCVGLASDDELGEDLLARYRASRSSPSNIPPGCPMLRSLGDGPETHF
ncbi:hypothetical protein [Streptomyces sp. TRM70350]|uniref:hypothetical protein n=1 Tax=Streptomyces sp. TRM70350 TaxID=2856165 RepID=UPI00210FE897|nr:hypothetical protein [Streptomyces sp. TRM70350]